MLAIAQTAIAFVDGEEYDALLHSHEEGDETVLEDGYYRWLASIVDRIVSANENIDGDMGVYFVAPAGGEDQVLAIYTDYDHASP